MEAVSRSGSTRFTGGRIRSNIAVHGARLEQAQRRYEQKVLIAAESGLGDFLSVLDARVSATPRCGVTWSLSKALVGGWK